jgi:hypothetical protein
VHGRIFIVSPEVEQIDAPTDELTHLRLPLLLLGPDAHELGEHERGGEAEDVAHDHERAIQVAAGQGREGLAEQRDVATRGQPGDVAKAIAEIPGAEVLPLKPSMRGDKGVAVRFNMTARKATEEVEHKPYVEKVQASDNLRWTLGGGMAASDDKPLGKTAPPAQVASATGTATGSPE